MNMYLELKKQQEKEINKFPIIFAFSKKQLIEGKEKLGLKETDKNKLLSIGGGGFIRKSDEKALDEMLNRHNKELKKTIDEDLTGDGFIYDMFNYELSNHEYCITYDIEDTLDSLGFTVEEIKNNSKLLNGLQRAIQSQERY